MTASTVNLAAMIRLEVDRETLGRLYQLGLIRADDAPEAQAEDLASALSRLSQEAMAYGIQIRR
jgi:hypothetical protein